MYRQSGYLHGRHERSSLLDNNKAHLSGRKTIYALSALRHNISVRQKSSPCLFEYNSL